MVKSPLEITFAAKDWFFDRAEVLRRVGEKRNKALLVAGAFIRRKARDLLRKGKKSAQAGKPPKIHSDQEPNLKTILFALDPATDSMVVGPVKLNQVQQSWIDFGSRTVPQIMEFGDVINVREQRKKGTKEWRRRDLRFNPTEDREYRVRRAIYKPHPFMSVALEKALPKIPEQFRDLI
jgi:hypothetical protein